MIIWEVKQVSSKKMFQPSLQRKLTLTFIATTMIVLLMNIFMYQNINRLITRLDNIYQSNLNLNTLEESLEQVQTDMTNYLNTKTTDAMEDYYRSEQTYRILIANLQEKPSNDPLLLMERNINKMSSSYLELTNQAIEAKRGRNIEKYKQRYDKASLLYSYISTYIYSLNNEQFKNNSLNYNALSASIQSLERVSTFLLVSVALGNVILITLLTQTITRPLKVLARTANQVAQGNLMVNLVEVQSKDEVGVVTKAFDKMVVSIREYITRLTASMEVEQNLRENELRMETHLKDAQLKYLQAQINPHFLFNTLNAGAQLAMMEGAERTNAYIQNMADFYRYNLKKNNEVVTLQEEIELVDNYIYILNVRFSGDIHFEKEIDESILQIKVPSMILQPLVENSINYGIRNIEWEGKIKLSIFRNNKRIFICVKDNGVGMSTSQIEKILSNLPSKAALSRDSNGIGLNNVIGRVRLFFDRQDIIEIHSDGEGKGTEVILMIPIEEGENHV